MKKTQKNILPALGFCLALLGCTSKQPSPLNHDITQAMQMPNHQASEHRLRNLIKQNPQQPVLYSTLGYQLDQQQKFDEAHQAYQQAITLEPKQPEWHNNLGVFLCQHQQIKQGRRELTKASELATEEESLWILENMARCK